MRSREMPPKLVRRARWIIYLCCLGLILGAILLPRVSISLLRSQSKAAVEEAVRQVSAAERRYFSKHGHYAPFGPSEPELTAVAGGPVAASRLFAFDAQLSADGGLVIRAMSRPDAIAARQVEPMVYTAEIPPLSGVVIP